MSRLPHANERRAALIEESLAIARQEVKKREEILANAWQEVKKREEILAALANLVDAETYPHRCHAGLWGWNDGTVDWLIGEDELADALTRVTYRISREVWNRAEGPPSFLDKKGTPDSHALYRAILQEITPIFVAGKDDPAEVRRRIRKEYGDEAEAAIREHYNW